MENRNDFGNDFGTFENGGLNPEEEEALRELYTENLEKDIPDIWDRINAGIDAIDAGVTDKKMSESAFGINRTVVDNELKSENSDVINISSVRKKRSGTLRRVAPLIAAAAVLAMVIPVWLILGNRSRIDEGDKSDNSMIYEETADGTAPDGASDDMYESNESAGYDMESDTESEQQDIEMAEEPQADEAPNMDGTSDDNESSDNSMQQAGESTAEDNPWGGDMSTDSDDKTVIFTAVGTLVREESSQSDITGQTGENPSAYTVDTGEYVYYLILSDYELISARYMKEKLLLVNASDFSDELGKLYEAAAETGDEVSITVEYKPDEAEESTDYTPVRIIKLQN